MRLDIYLIENHFFASREQAKVNIAKGNVLINGTRAKKPSQDVQSTDRVEVSGENVVKYVSRGGLKLEKALRAFEVDCTNIIALDVGSSTGGFTHCLLLHGAKKVYAVDVGTQQLDERLRNHPQVVSIENKNIKDLKPERVDGNSFNIVVADLSFVSLTKILPYLAPFANSEGKLIVLIKPQFEAGPQALNRSGLVKNPKHHIEAIENAINKANGLGFFLKGITYTPFIERNKNIEYLALFDRKESTRTNIADVVSEAFEKQAEL